MNHDKKLKLDSTYFEGQIEKFQKLLTPTVSYNKISHNSYLLEITLQYNTFSILTAKAYTFNTKLLTSISKTR